LSVSLQSLDLAFNTLSPLQTRGQRQKRQEAQQVISTFFENTPERLTPFRHPLDREHTPERFRHYSHPSDSFTPFPPPPESVTPLQHHTHEVQKLKAELEHARERLGQGEQELKLTQKQLEEERQSVFRLVAQLGEEQRKLIREQQHQLSGSTVDNYVFEEDEEVEEEQEQQEEQKQQEQQEQEQQDVQSNDAPIFALNNSDSEVVPSLHSDHEDLHFVTRESFQRSSESLPRFNYKMAEFSTKLPNNVCPEPFKGSEGDDASMWLKRFELYTTLKGWDLKQLASAFPLFLRDSAAVWYDSLDEEQQVSYEQIKEKFKERYFLHKSMHWVRLNEFSKRVQQADETAMTYTQVMLKLGKQLVKTDKELMEAIVAGYRPHIKMYVIDKEPHNVEEALMLARKAESLKDDSFQTLQDQMLEMKLQLTKGLASMEKATAETISVVKKQDTNFMKGNIPAFSTMTSQSRFSGPNTQQRFPPPNTQIRYSRPPALPRGVLQQQYGQRYRQCYGCGLTNHSRATCRFANAKCFACGKIGHSHTVCMSAQRQGRPSTYTPNYNSSPFNPGQPRPFPHPQYQQYALPPPNSPPALPAP